MSSIKPAVVLYFNNLGHHLHHKVVSSLQYFSDSETTLTPYLSFINIVDEKESQEEREYDSFPLKSYTIKNYSKWQESSTLLKTHRDHIPTLVEEIYLRLVEVNNLVVRSANTQHISSKTRLIFISETFDSAGASFARYLAHEISAMVNHLDMENLVFESICILNQYTDSASKIISSRKQMHGQSFASLIELEKEFQHPINKVVSPFSTCWLFGVPNEKNIYPQSQTGFMAALAKTLGLYLSTGTEETYNQKPVISRTYSGRFFSYSTMGVMEYKWGLNAVTQFVFSKLITKFIAQAAEKKNDPANQVTDFPHLDTFRDQVYALSPNGTYFQDEQREPTWPTPLTGKPFQVFIKECEVIVKDYINSIQIKKAQVPGLLVDEISAYLTEALEATAAEHGSEIIPLALEALLEKSDPGIYSLYNFLLDEEYTQVQDPTELWYADSWNEMLDAYNREYKVVPRMPWYRRVYQTVRQTLGIGASAENPSDNGEESEPFLSLYQSQQVALFEHLNEYIRSSEIEVFNSAIKGVLRLGEYQSFSERMGESLAPEVNIAAFSQSTQDVKPTDDYSTQVILDHQRLEEIYTLFFENNHHEFLKVNDLLRLDFDQIKANIRSKIIDSLSEEELSYISDFAEIITDIEKESLPNAIYRMLSNAGVFLKARRGATLTSQYLLISSQEIIDILYQDKSTERFEYIVDDTFQEKLVVVKVCNNIELNNLYDMPRLMYSYEEVVNGRSANLHAPDYDASLMDYRDVMMLGKCDEDEFAKERLLFVQLRFAHLLEYKGGVYSYRNTDNEKVILGGNKDVVLKKFTNAHVFELRKKYEAWKLNQSISKLKSKGEDFCKKMLGPDSIYTYCDRVLFEEYIHNLCDENELIKERLLFVQLRFANLLEYNDGVYSYRISNNEKITLGDKKDTVLKMLTNGHVSELHKKYEAWKQKQSISNLKNKGEDFCNKMLGPDSLYTHCDRNLFEEYIRELK